MRVRSSTSCPPKLGRSAKLLPAHSSGARHPKDLNKCNLALPGLVCTVDNRQYWTRCQTYHLVGDAAQEHVSPPSTLACPHDDEIGVALMGDAHNSVCRRPDRDFCFPVPIEGIGHEVAELG